MTFRTKHPGYPTRSKEEPGLRTVNCRGGLDVVMTLCRASPHPENVVGTRWPHRNSQTIDGVHSRRKSQRWLWPLTHIPFINRLIVLLNSPTRKAEIPPTGHLSA